MNELMTEIGAGSQQHELLLAYRRGRKLTPDEAVQETNLSILSCYWKRVSELAAMGYLTITGSAVGPLRGGTQKVYKITTLGRQALKALD